MDNEDAMSYFSRLTRGVINKMQDEIIAVSERSDINPNSVHEMLYRLNAAEFELEQLLKLTEAEAGWCSHYPQICLDHLKMMQKILEKETMRVNDISVKK